MFSAIVENGILRAFLFGVRRKNYRRYSCVIVDSVETEKRYF